MTRRCIALVLLVVLAVPSSALAQGEVQGGGGNPFGPLPQAPPPPPPEAPAPQPVDTSTDDDDGLGGTAFWMIIGATGAVFAGIGFFIVRDMRRTVGGPKKRRRVRGTGRPAADAAQALAGESRHTPGSQRARAKAQQRAKTKAARKQRRRARSR